MNESCAIKGNITNHRKPKHTYYDSVSREYRKREEKKAMLTPVKKQPGHIAHICVNHIM